MEWPVGRWTSEEPEEGGWERSLALFAFFGEVYVLSGPLIPGYLLLSPCQEEKNKKEHHAIRPRPPSSALLGPSVFTLHRRRPDGPIRRRRTERLLGTARRLPLWLSLPLLRQRARRGRPASRGVLLHQLEQGLVVVLEGGDQLPGGSDTRRGESQRSRASRSDICVRGREGDVMKNVRSSAS